MCGREGGLTCGREGGLACRRDGRLRQGVNRLVQRR